MTSSSLTHKPPLVLSSSTASSCNAICTFTCELLPCFLPFLLSLNILWGEPSGATIAKLFSSLPNTPITLFNSAAWLGESRKSSLRLTWAHRLSACPKAAQTEVFITGEEGAQKEQREWRQRRQPVDLRWFYGFWKPTLHHSDICLPLWPQDWSRCKCSHAWIVARGFIAVHIKALHFLADGISPRFVLGFFFFLYIVIHQKTCWVFVNHSTLQHDCTEEWTGKSAVSAPVW